MLVFVKVLREKGRRLARERVNMAAPHRGKLDLVQHKRTDPDRLLATLLSLDRKECVLPPLDYARVTRICEVGILIVGQEQLGHSVDRLQLYRQAWWVLPGGGS